MNWFLSYLLEASACLVVLYLLYVVFFRRLTFFQINRIYLLLMFPLAFAIPQVQIVLHNPELVVFQPIEILEIPTFQGEMEISRAEQETFVPKFTFSLWSAIELVYILGFSWMLIRLVKRCINLVKLIRLGRNYPFKGAYLVEVSSPFPASSFFHYIFCTNITTALREPMLLQHELVHVRQGHSIDRLWIELWGILNWFNPLIYFIKRDLQVIHEYIADDKVVAQTGALYEYATLLAVQSNPKIANRLVNTFYSLTKKRLQMLSREKSGNQVRLHYFWTIPIVAFLMLIYSFDILKESPGANLSSHPIEVEQQILPDSKYTLEWGALRVPFNANLYANFSVDAKVLYESIQKQPKLLFDGKVLDLKDAVLIQMTPGKEWQECNIDFGRYADQTWPGPCAKEIIEQIKKDDILYLTNLKLPEGDFLSARISIYRAEKPISTVDNSKLFTVDKDISSASGVDNTPMMLERTDPTGTKMYNVWTTSKLKLRWGTIESSTKKNYPLTDLKKTFNRPLVMLIEGKEYPILGYKLKVESADIDVSFSGIQPGGEVFDQFFEELDESVKIRFSNLRVQMGMEESINLLLPDLFVFNIAK